MQPRNLNNLCRPILLMFAKWCLFYRHKSKGSDCPYACHEGTWGGEEV